MRSLSAPHRVVCYGTVIANQIAELGRMLGPGFQIEGVPPDSSRAQLQQQFNNALAIIAMELPSGLIWQGNALFQVPAAGWEHLRPEQVPAGTPICNVGGHEIGVAEYCLAQMLAWRHQLRAAEDVFRSGSWAYSARRGASPHDELYGNTVGLIGYGGIGRALAPRLHALGLRVLAANRSFVPNQLPVSGVFDIGGLATMLDQCDFGIVCMGDAPETRGLVGPEQLAALGPKGVIINVGRGPVIDEAALYESLKIGRLGGAILDVWYRYPQANSNYEPPPSRFDFAALPNVMMTPHISGFTTGTVDRRLAAMAENIRRAASGQELLNVVAVGSSVW